MLPDPTESPITRLKPCGREAVICRSIHTLYCLMGADSFGVFQQWFRAAEIPFVAPLIVASRPGQPLTDLKALLPAGLALETAVRTGALKFGQQTRRKSSFNVIRWSIRQGSELPFYLLPELDIPISASKYP